MPSKTVWIAGGIVVAIGAIAYLSYNKAPAGKDAAGTIVEAKRARSDGTNSFNPAPTASTNDTSAADAAKAAADADAAKAADAAAAAGSGDKGKPVMNKLKATDAADAALAGAGSGGSRGIANTRGLEAQGSPRALEAKTEALEGKRQ
jgi:hypothetical protein